MARREMSMALLNLKKMSFQPGEILGQQERSGKEAYRKHTDDYGLKSHVANGELQFLKPKARQRRKTEDFYC